MILAADGWKGLLAAVSEPEYFTMLCSLVKLTVMLEGGVCREVKKKG
jgi:hypothetical protein